MPNTLNHLLGVDTGKQGALATEWGLPLPVYLTVEETQSMAAWNRQVYLSTTIPRYAMNLTDSARLMFQSTWWFDSSKAKTDLDWNPVDILEVIRECVAENGVWYDLYKKTVENKRVIDSKINCLQLLWFFFLRNVSVLFQI